MCTASILRIAAPLAALAFIAASGPSAPKTSPPNKKPISKIVGGAEQASAQSAARNAGDPFGDVPPKPPAARPAARHPKAVAKEPVAAVASPDESPYPILPGPSSAEKMIEAALNRPTTIEFVDSPFKDVTDYLRDLHHIEIQLDLAALKDAGFDENMEISKSLKGISLSSALDIMLSDHGWHGTFATRSCGSRPPRSFVGIG